MKHKRSSNPLSRSGFLRTFLLAMVFTITFQHHGVAQVPKETDQVGGIESTTAMREICFVLDAEDEIASSTPVRWAVGQLRESLKQKGVNVSTRSAVDTASDTEFAIIVAGSKNPLSQKILKQSHVSVSETPESLGLLQGRVAGKKVLLACGSDSTGLMYAILELADRLQCGIPPADALTVAKPIVETPALQVRGIYRTFTSDVEDLPW